MNRLIGFTGMKGSGKTTAAAMLIEILKPEFPEQIRFDDPMSEIAAYTTNRLGLTDPNYIFKICNIVNTLLLPDEKPLIDIWKKEAGWAIMHNMVVIVDDLNTDERIKAVKELGGIVIKMDTTESNIMRRLHRGYLEMQFCHYTADITINNNGGLDELKPKLLLALDQMPTLGHWM